MGITYKDSGVDKEAGYKQVQMIKRFIKNTYNDRVLSDLGGFGGLFSIANMNMEEPVLVSGTDGVGTKLIVAQLMDKHDTIGMDCVAMCVNDILCSGAKPLFFLDYIATGKLEPEKMANIVKGIADACVLAESALIGGETAEMPGLYAEEDYDVAGFSVGIVDRKKIIDGSKISDGDILFALNSSGVHSNGFSLIRKIVFELKKMEANDYVEELGSSIGAELLKPTKIYVKEVLALLDKVKINGLCHITGGGFYENIPRMLPDNCMAEIQKDAVQIPKIFKLLQEWGNITEDEMFGTFNMGVGMVMAIDPSDEELAEKILKELGADYCKLGKIKTGKKSVVIC